MAAGFIPLGRFLGMLWIIVIAFRLPARRGDHFPRPPNVRFPEEPARFSELSIPEEKTNNSERRFVFGLGAFAIHCSA